MNNITKAIIALQIVVIIVLSFTFYSHNKRMEMLKNRTETLEMQLGIKEIELKDLKQDLAITIQELKTTKIKYASKVLMFNYLRTKYLTTKIYANFAEEILIANGIEWRQTD